MDEVWNCRQQGLTPAGLADEAMNAFRSGAMGATHLFNAMEGMTSRAPGSVGAALSSPDIYTGLIADMLHVSPASAVSAIRAKGVNRMYLTTDAVSPWARMQNRSISTVCV